MRVHLMNETGEYALVLWSLHFLIAHVVDQYRGPYFLPSHSEGIYCNQHSCMSSLSLMHLCMKISDLE